jgi:hypothetical protein
MADAPMQWVLRQMTPPTATPHNIQVPEANSQDCALGEPVYVDVSVGYAKKATASTVLLGVAAEAFANDAAAQTGALTKNVMEITPEQVWEGTIINGEDGINDKAAQTDLYKSYEIVESSNEANVWCVNKAGTTNKRVTIVGFVDAVGTIYGRVLFRFIGTNLQGFVVDS